MRWVDRVGIELEGGWKKKWPFGEAEHPNLIADDSLPAQLVAPDGSVCLHAGEKTSPPLEWEEVRAWMLKYYPDSCTERCGLHVHVSMKSAQAYSILGSLAFYEHFLCRMNAWGDKHLTKSTADYDLFFQRLLGFNKYCVLKLNPYEQMRARNKAEARRAMAGGHQLRRTHLNFPYGMLKTLECRLFPMFSEPMIAYRAVEEFVKMCESWVEENMATFEVARSYKIVTKRTRRS